jgi:hypothetical protein
MRCAAPRGPHAAAPRAAAPRSRLPQPCAAHRVPAAGQAGGVPRRSALAVGALGGATLAGAAMLGLAAAGMARAALSDTGLVTRRGMAKFIRVRAPAAQPHALPRSRGALPRAPR